MPRPMLRNPLEKQDSKTNTILSTQQPRQKQKSSQLDKMQVDRILRQKRSPKYMEVIRNLDAGGHVMNQQRVNQIIDALREEFPELSEYQGSLLGYVSKCYLGRPYEVHCLDFTGQILEHYKQGESLPNGMEKARGMAMYGGYEFIEVYVDCCRCVAEDGSVSVISG